MTGTTAWIEVSRGGFVESRHAGHYCVVDADGAVVDSGGDIAAAIFPRSAVKALQALPLIESGAADRFGLSAAEIALACASHSGEPEHARTAARMLAKAGQGADCLECGAHWPMGERAQRALAARGERPCALHNNCSGKHAGFVCLACALEEDPAGYVRADHAVQRILAATLSEVTGAPHDLERAGIDGCAIPTHAVPLQALALGFARFGTGAGFGMARARAAARIRAAVAAHPFMVAGSGRFDPVLMQALGARVFCKTGAEGVFCASLPEQGFGLALKIADGHGRAAEALMAQLVLRHLPVAGAARQVVEGLARPALRNWNGQEVGAITVRLPD